jgi:hypothetical protein
VSEPLRRQITRTMELPCACRALRTVDERVLADLVDGRTIDITDWFADTHERPN